MKKMMIRWGILGKNNLQTYEVYMVHILRIAGYHITAVYHTQDVPDGRAHDFARYPKDIALII